MVNPITVAKTADYVMLIGEQVTVPLGYTVESENCSQCGYSLKSLYWISQGLEMSYINLIKCK